MARRHLDDAAQRALVHQPAQREEVAVPAPVVEYRQHEPALVGERHEFARVRQRHRERLVDHHVAARQQRGAGERMVGVVGRGDHHEIEVGARDQLRRGGVHGHVGPVGVHLGRVGAGDGHEMEVGHRRDQRRMEGLAGIAVADESDLQAWPRMRRHRITSVD